MESRRKMTMLRWLCGVAKKDDDAEVDVWSRKERLKWYRHTGEGTKGTHMLREGTKGKHMLRRMLEAQVPRKRRREEGHVQRRLVIRCTSIGKEKGRRACAKKIGNKMHQYWERDGEEDRKPGGKTCVKEVWKVSG